MSNLNTAVPLPVASDLSASRHALVYISSTGVALAGPGDRAIGTLFEPNKKHDPDTGSYVGDACTVFLSAGNGFHDVLVGNTTAIALGDELEAGASGVVNKKVDRTVTGANTGDLWTASAAHGFVANQAVVFSALDSGGSGFSVGVTYYVRTTGLTSTVFGLSATPGGGLLPIGTGDYSTSTISAVAIGVAASACPSSSNGGGRIHAVLYPAANPSTVGTATTSTGTGNQVLQTSPTLVTPVLGVATGTSLAATGLITSSSPSAGIGYATGAGSTVSQATDRTTGVTINALSGAITTQATSLATAGEVSFTVTNSSVAVGDVVIANIRSGPTTLGSTQVSVTAVAAGSFQLTLNNLHASTADTGAAIINFAVIKAVSA